MTARDRFHANLSTVALSTTRVGGLCAYGQTGIGWGGPHHYWSCYIATAEGCRQFDAAVVRGEYDAEGYTPAERRKLAKKQREA
jgi:hypothetical protein